ncbi:MAG TPA: hypothetical protein VH331_18835 [Allosphingosinicella sp.]|jgi:hypothetical protein|nr:hypothetical protein [Allosphingosinicella sp.]
MLILLALLADANGVVGQRMSRMTALYEQVCLKAFPDDKAVEALMSAQHARPLTAEEVKITMRDDPAEGWALTEDGNPSVWIELPPFHACSVRWNMPELGNLGQYQAVAAKYEAGLGGFHPIDPLDADDGAIHIHAVGERRALSGGAAETLFIIDQHITDPQRRAAGETGYVLRFVHQFAPPPPGSPK